MEINKSTLREQDILLGEYEPNHREPFHPPKSYKPSCAVCTLLIIILVLLLGTAGVLGYLLYKVQTEINNNDASHEYSYDNMFNQVKGLEGKDIDMSKELEKIGKNITDIETQIGLNVDIDNKQNNQITALQGDNLIINQDIQELNKNIEETRVIENENMNKIDYLMKEIGDVKNNIQTLSSDIQRMRYILFDTKLQGAIDIFFYKAICRIIIEGVEEQPDLHWVGDGKEQFECDISTRGRAIFGRYGVKVCVEYSAADYRLVLISTEEQFCAGDQQLDIYEGGNIYIYIYIEVEDESEEHVYEIRACPVTF